MALSIQVDDAVYPPDMEVAIEGVGRFVNGGASVEVPQSAEEAFFVINGRPLDDEDEGVSVSGSAEFTPPEPEPEEETEQEAPAPAPEPQPEPEVPTETQEGDV